MSYKLRFTSPSITPVKKRLVICCDGTWQSSTDLDPNNAIPSNVTRLCRVIARAGEDPAGEPFQQIVYYDAGVGTGRLTWLNKYMQGALGLGIVENIIEAYHFIVNNYAPRDEILLFGFSRGAYTVRAVAELVCEVGVLTTSSMHRFTEIYHMFANRKEEDTTSFKDFPKWKHYREQNKGVCIAEDVSISVIGVWDTVAGPLSQKHFRLSLYPNIKHAFQALALDERRKLYAPDVWKLPKDGHIRTRLCQVWFPGVHISVGGGTSDNIEDVPREDREQFADITFAWMLDRIQPYLALDWSSLDQMLGSNAGLKDLGYATGVLHDSMSFIWWLLGGAKTRSPGSYHDPDNEYTVERIHPSVHFRQYADARQGRTAYRPAALEGWRREWSADEKNRRHGWVWRKDGSSKKLWEFKIGHMPQERSVERRLIERFTWPAEILQQLDDEWGWGDDA